MQFIEDIKWWQWIVISLFVGGVLGYVNSRGADTPIQHAAMTTRHFEQRIAAPLPDPNNPGHFIPWISNIVVHPPRLLRLKEKTEQVQLVSFNCLATEDKSHASAWMEKWVLTAPIPYVPEPVDDVENWTGRYGNLPYPGMTIYRGQWGDTLDSIEEQFYGKVSPQGRRAIVNANFIFREASSSAAYRIQPGKPYWIPWNPSPLPPGKPPTVSDFLVAANKVASKYRTPEMGANSVTFTYAWWEIPAVVYPIWVGGCLLTIGLIWPALLSVMVKGGLGRAKAEDEYDLSRFKGGKEPARKAPVVAPTQNDMQKLRELEEAMAASLKSAGAGEVSAAQPAQPVPVAIKKLSGGPAVEAAPAAPQEEEKSYSGEYYPVVHPGGKKTEK